MNGDLLPEHTGVDGVVVWIFAGEFSRTEAQYGPRILVVPGHELRVESLIDLPDKIEPQVVEWVERNRDVLLEYWRGGMATDDAIELLVRV